MKTVQSRRSVLGGLGLAPLAAAQSEASGQAGTSAPISSRDNLRITRLETLLVRPRWLFLKIHTNAGIVGLGELYLEGLAKTCAEGVKEVEPSRGGRFPGALRRSRNGMAADCKRILETDQGRAVARDGGHAYLEPEPLTTAISAASGRPVESASIGKRFSIRENVLLSIRAEFFNIFNRNEVVSDPSTGSPSNPPTRDGQGRLTGGFGYMNYTAVTSNSVGGTLPAPPTGQIVARFEF